MNISEQDLKKILAAIQRLIYDKAVLVEKDKEILEIINKLTGENK